MSLSDSSEYPQDLLVSTLKAQSKIVADEFWFFKNYFHKSR